MADAPLCVRAYTPEDASAWDRFVDQCPQSTFFHRAGWQQVIEQAFGHKTHYLLAQRGSDILGILPLARVTHFYFGDTLSSLPFGVYGGIASIDDEATRRLDLAAQDLAHALGVDQLEYRQRQSLHADWPRKDLYVTFRKEIDPDPDANMKAIPRKQRAMVRSGIKNGLVSEIDAGVDRFYRVFADNMRRHGTPVFSKKYFRILKEVFGEDCEVLSVLKDGRVVSSVMTFYFKDEMLPYYAGYLVSARDLAANDFKYWELMRRGCQRGGRVFDYGRSKIGTGPYGFKKNWGFEPQPLHYEYHLVKATHVPDQNPLNPKYQLFIKAWRHLPMPLTKIIGPSLVKFLA